MSWRTGARGHVVVVGASLAGLSAARSLRAEGFAGELTIVGAEERLPYDRPPLSKELLAGQASADELALVDPGELARLDARWLLGTAVVGLRPGERRVLLHGGRSLRYDGLVVATGSVARRLPAVPGQRVLRTLDDALALRAVLLPGSRLVIAGAGFVGCEVAATARTLGVDVTLVEAGPAPLAGALGVEIGEAVARPLVDAGVDLRCGRTVRPGRWDGGSTRIELDDGAVLEADAVLVAVGARPATDWLAGSGLPVDDGVVCDERCGTAAPGVVAAGDVASWMHPGLGRRLRVEHVEHAERHGAAAGRALLRGAAAEPFAPVPFVWSQQGDHVLHVAGFAEGEPRLVEGGLGGGPFVVVWTRHGRTCGVAAFDSPRTFRRLRRQLEQDPALAAAAAA